MTRGTNCPLQGNSLWVLSPSSKIQFTGAPCSPPPSSAWFAGGCRPSQRFLQGGEVDKTLPSCLLCPRGCSDHDTHHSLDRLSPFSRVNSCFLSRAPPIPPPSLVHLSSLPAAEGRPEAVLFPAGAASISRLLRHGVRSCFSPRADKHSAEEWFFHFARQRKKGSPATPGARQSGALSGLWGTKHKYFRRVL